MSKCNNNDDKKKRNSSQAGDRRMKKQKKQGKGVFVWVTNGSKGEYEANLNVNGKHEDINDLLREFNSANDQNEFEVQYTLGGQIEKVRKWCITMIPKLRPRRTPRRAQELLDERVKTEVSKKF